MSTTESRSTDDGMEEFGYHQSLERSLGKFASFAAGVSYISILTGTFQLFYFGFGIGGPTYWWSWPLVFVGQLMVALCFAELAGRYPVAGSVYNWSKRLAGPTVSWLAGWMMFTASVVTLAAVVLAYQVTLPQIWSGFQLVGDGTGASFGLSAVIWGAILVVFTTLVNAFGVKLMARINSAGVFIELIAACLLVVILAVNIVNPPSVIVDTTGYGDGSGGYFGAFLVAAIASAYVMYGFDTASSLGEETVDPRRTGPTAILRAVIASFVIGGLILLFGILAAPNLADPELGKSSGGLQLIVLQALGGPLGKVFLVCIVVAVTVCALAVHTAGIRLMFAMARDNALPGGAALARIDPVRKTPVVPAVIIGVVAVLILVLNIGTPEIFTAVTSVAVIMIYVAYLLVTVPMLIKRLKGEWPGKDAPKGYFSLGALGLPVNIVAVIWGAAMALDLAWPRADVYGDFPWIAFIFIGAVALVGLLWFWTRGRHHLGTLPEHVRRDLEQGPVTGTSDAAAATFDYVVVGGGSSGCALAARLSEDPAVTVCLLEAGPSDVDDPNILRLTDWMALLDSGYDWDYLVEPQEHGNSFLRHARAKVLGGCSSHNSCIAFWTPREDLDEWAASGCTGWSADECWPLIRRLETNDGEWEGHGRSGPVTIHHVAPDDPCGVAVLEAAAAVGLPTVRFNEGSTVTEGAGFFQINREPDGTRASSSRAYLHPIMGKRSNLTVITGAWASRILFDGTRATGVEYQQDIGPGRRTVHAGREVVVSAGSIDTPKLLMLSGIGPAGHLREFGIDVLVDAPGVGANLDDHVEGLVMWEAARPMVTRSTQWWEIGLFTRTPEASADGLDRPDLMMHYGSVPFDLNTVRWGYPTTDNGFCLTPNVTRGRSRGTVRLRSRDFRDRARVDPRYFTDPDGHDMRVMLHGVKLARRIAEQPALKEWITRELTPGPDAVTDDELADYVTKTHNTVYHPACTAKMGPDSDPMAVVDPQLRVRGVTGLRLADASILPFLPAINPNITCMMIGEKCADLLRA